MAGVKDGKGVPGRPRRKLTPMELRAKEREVAAKEARKAERAKELEEKIAKRNNTKTDLVDEAYDLPIPDDGIDHARWSPQARFLCRNLLDPDYAGASNKRYAELSGLSLRQAERLMNDPEFKRYLNAVADRAFDDDIYPLLVTALKRGLRSEKPGKYVELVLKARGMLKDVKVVESTLTVKDARDASNNDLDAAIEELEKRATPSNEVN